MKTCFAAVALMLVAGCGATQSRGTAMPDERLLACDGLLERLAAIDTSVAAEADLVAAMDEADAATDRCADAWIDHAADSADLVLARHRAAQLPLRSLTFEAALSQRFDEMANYCAIVEDLFALILGSLGELDSALSDETLHPQDRRTFEELRDLDLETVDVLLTATTEFCGES